MLRALLLVLTTSLALPAAAEVDVQHWHNLFIMGRLTAPSSPSAPSSTAPSSTASSSTAPSSPSPALFYLELQPRFSISGSRPDRVLLRAALGWEVAREPGRSLTLWAGVGAIPSFVAPDWHVNETRFWQQLMFVDRLGDVQLTFRGRVEERLFELAPASPALRVRAMLRAVYTLPVGQGAWGIVAFDEAFVGVAGPAERLGFDQNRAFLGVLHRFAPWFSVEAGYLHVTVGADRVLPTFLVQTTVNLM